LRQLPRHHVHRPRLVERLEPARLAVVEAGAGYGKTSLAEELAAHLGLAVMTVAFEPRDEAAELFAARLGGALRGFGLASAAEAVTARGAEPAEAALAALRSLPEPVLLVLDDAHHCSGTAACHLVRLVSRMPDPHRALVLARALPRAAAVLARSDEVVVLDACDLALTAGEVAELLAAGWDVELSSRDASALAAATGGWAAAVVLAATRLARSPDRAAALEVIAAQPTVLAYLVQEHLAELDDAERTALVQLAHLPLLSAAVGRAIGRDGLVERAVELGLPLMPVRDGWYELPGPLQDYLAAIAPLEPEVARLAAAHYVERAEALAALRVLLGTGDGAAAAELLATLPPSRIEALDFAELRSLLDGLPDEAVREHPAVLLRFARAAQFTEESAPRAAALARAARIAAERGDERLARETEGELACDLVRDGRREEGAMRAEAVLAACGRGERLARARALEAIATALATSGDDESLARAEPLFEESARLVEEAGETAWASATYALLGYYVVYARGHHHRALEWIERAIELAGARRRARALAGFCRAEVLVDCGRHAGADAALAEVRELAASLRDVRLLAYATWEAARLAAQQGDPETAVALLREVEQTRGAWFATATGGEFLAAAAEIAAIAGELGLSREYLDRGQDRAAPSATPALLVAEAGLEARSGDPAVVDGLLDRAIAAGPVPARERWRLTLLRALAALRHGDPRAGGLAAEAFEAAAALGTPELPFVRERAAAERLVALAAESGSRSAARLATGHGAVSVTVLGGFGVTSGGRLVAMPEGQPEQLVKLLAASGGRLHADEAIEALWPEVDPDRGRKRLRNVLNRLRTGAGELVVRDGESLRLAPEIEVDAIRFEEEAARALATGLPGERSALARAALARYRGDLLPDDPYEAWAAGPRERLRRRCLALLDLLAGEAEARGDAAEALRLLERGIDADPYEQERYLRSARLLLGQGRHVAAARVLRRARDVLERLGLPAPPELVELARQVRE
jgi:ATP/maltotriose-dependent transcriptional regulator MalT/DNA-binding SARP family transcriptional activator